MRSVLTASGLRGWQALGLALLGSAALVGARAEGGIVPVQPPTDRLGDIHSTVRATDLLEARSIDPSDQSPVLAPASVPVEPAPSEGAPKPKSDLWKGLPLGKPGDIFGLENVITRAAEAPAVQPPFIMPPSRPANGAATAIPSLPASWSGSICLGGLAIAGMLKRVRRSLR